MRFAITLFVLLFASNVQAETKLEPWQTKSAEALGSFNKFKEVSWEQEISLWIFVDNDGSEWAAVHDYVCQTLKGNGKPDSAFVVVTFWDHQAALAGSPVRYAKQPC